MAQDPATSTDHENALSEAEAAAMLGVSTPTMRRYRRAGRPLAAYLRPTPRRVTYLRSDVDAARAKMRTPTVSEVAVAEARAEIEAEVGSGA